MRLAAVSGNFARAGETPPPGISEERMIDSMREHRSTVREAVLVALAVLAVGAGPGVARAGERSGPKSGTLSKVTRAVREHSSAGARSGSRAPSSGNGSEPSHRRTDSIYRDDPGRWYHTCATCVPVAAGPYASGAAAARPGPVPPTRLMLAVGLQSVEGSDGAARGGLHISKGGLGLSASMARYFERGPAMGGAIFMDVWSVAAAGRLLHAGGSELWLHGGLGGTGSTEFEPLMGPVIGAALVHPLGGNLGLRGSVRHYVLEQDTRASEASAGIGVSFLSVGYRVLRFNVGPVLHGPEFDLTLRF